jgi:hypothetical protein
MLGGGAETARAFGVTPQAVHNWLARGKLPARRHLQALKLAAGHGVIIDPEVLK